MGKYFLRIALVIFWAGAVFAQQHTTNATTTATNTTSVATNGQAIDFQSGTQLAAQLQNTLDVRKAKVGDEVVLKTTQAIKANGRTVVNKGARLVGHVTEVSQKTKANGQSSIGLVFDRLESGSLETPISATITSITRAPTRTRAGNDGLGGIGSETSAGSTSSARTSSRQSSSGGGGLLGGVGGTVGGVLNTTTQTTGSVVGTTTGAVGETAGGVTQAVGGIRISESTDASVEGSSTLSLTGDNLRLEKGTAFNLRLNQAATVDNRNDQ